LYCVHIKCRGHTAASVWFALQAQNGAYGGPQEPDVCWEGHNLDAAKHMCPALTQALGFPEAQRAAVETERADITCRIWTAFTDRVTNTCRLARLYKDLPLLYAQNWRAPVAGKLTHLDAHW
jgi:hypothetical protein